MISAEEIFRINKIKKDKNWPEWVGSKKYGYDLFEVLAEFLSNFLGRERDLAFNFLEKFDVIRNYEFEVECLLDSIPDEYFSGKCYIIPNGMKSASETKSGHDVVYIMKINIPHKFKKLVIFPDSILSKYIIFDKATYIIVDDFVGSGRQFVETLKHLTDNGVEISSIKLATICITERALERISSLGVTVYHVHSYKKAIEDKVATGRFSVAEAYAIYEDMFSKIIVSNQLKLGYGKCETLLTMKSTPNNTLPIFWGDKATGGGKWPAPFPR